MRLRLIGVSIVFLFFCCNNHMKKIDLIIQNAVVYTCDSVFHLAESFAVDEGIILAVGTNDEIKSFYSSSNIIDANGMAVFPGFIDAHSHFLGYGLNMLVAADLSHSESFDDIIERIKSHHKKFNTFWIQGRGWDQNKWHIKEFPSREKLDSMFPDNPVYLVRIDGHAALVNSKALEIAGITTQTQVEGGIILHKNGIPTGILLDNAMDLVRNKIPLTDNETKIAALKEAQKNCFAVGLTSVTDAGLNYKDVMLIDSLHKQEIIQIKLNIMLEPEVANIEHFVKKGIYSTKKMNVRSVKLYADGALGSRGACLLEPYSDSPNIHGIMVNEDEYLGEICRTAYQYGYQVCTHAIGDSANRAVLNIYGSVLKTKNDLRWRIEHAQVINEKDFKLFKEYSIIPSIQTTHATSDMYWAESRLGKERLKNAYSYKTLLEQNNWLCNGTDFPIENINPLYSFYAAVCRKDLKGFPPDGFQKENALSRTEALMAMTVWAAMASFEEKNKGSIEVGKAADFVILDKDIMNIDEGLIPGVRVVATYLDGIKVYEKE